MKRTNPSNHVRKETEVAASNGRRDRLTFVHSVNQFFGEKGVSSFSREKETNILHACERFLEYSGRSPQR